MGLRLPEDEYHALCKVVLERDGYRCRHCGMRSNLGCHHMVYRSHGGEDSMENLATLCNSCHIQGVHAGKLMITWDDQGANGKMWFETRGGWRPE